MTKFDDEHLGLLQKIAEAHLRKLLPPTATITAVQPSSSSLSKKRRRQGLEAALCELSRGCANNKSNEEIIQALRHREQPLDGTDDERRDRLNMHYAINREFVAAELTNAEDQGMLLLVHEKKNGGRLLASMLLDNYFAWTASPRFAPAIASDSDVDPAMSEAVSNLDREVLMLQDGSCSSSRASSGHVWRSIIEVVFLMATSDRTAATERGLGTALEGVVGALATKLAQKRCAHCAPKAIVLQATTSSKSWWLARGYQPVKMLFKPNDDATADEERYNCSRESLHAAARAEYTSSHVVAKLVAGAGN